MTSRATDVNGDVAERLLAIIAEIADVRPEEVSMTLPIFDEGGLIDTLGLDSLDALELSLAISQEFKLHPRDVLHSNIRNLRDLVTLVARISIAAQSGADN